MRYAVPGLALLTAVVAISAPALAADFRPYSAAALQAARAEGRPVVVHVYASWCPTCRAQAPLIRSIGARPDYARLLVLTLDYDRQKPDRKLLGVRQQSTLIAYARGQETGRTVGVTSLDGIKAMLDKAIGR